MGGRRFSQRHDTVDENPEDSRTGQLKRALQIFSALGTQSTDDPKTLLVETFHVECDEPAAMRADGHEPPPRREAVERARPEGRIADVLEHHVRSAPSGDPHDLSLEILTAVVHAQIRTETPPGPGASVRPRRRAPVGPPALRG